MAVIEQQTNGRVSEALTDVEKGRIAFDFIQDTAKRLALAPEFYSALVREFFDRNAQTYPRYYGVNVIKGYLWHIVSFVGHDRVEKPDGNTSLEISKYDVNLIHTDPDRAFVGNIHAYASWVEVDGIKNFRYGGASYRDQATGFSRTNDTKLALSRGRILIAELITPVNF